MLILIHNHETVPHIYTS